jgi:hypothetical protein
VRVMGHVRRATLAPLRPPASPARFSLGAGCLPLPLFLASLSSHPPSTGTIPVYMNASCTPGFISTSLAPP